MEGTEGVVAGVISSIWGGSGWVGADLVKVTMSAIRKHCVKALLRSIIIIIIFSLFYGSIKILRPWQWCV